MNWKITELAFLILLLETNKEWQGWINLDIPSALDKIILPKIVRSLVSQWLRDIFTSVIRFETLTSSLLIRFLENVIPKYYTSGSTLIEAMTELSLVWMGRSPEAFEEKRLYLGIYLPFIYLLKKWMYHLQIDLF